MNVTINAGASIIGPHVIIIRKAPKVLITQTNNLAIGVHAAALIANTITPMNATAIVISELMPNAPFSVSRNPRTNLLPLRRSINFPQAKCQGMYMFHRCVENTLQVCYTSHVFAREGMLYYDTTKRKK